MLRRKAPVALLLLLLLLLPADLCPQGASTFDCDRSCEEGPSGDCDGDALPDVCEPDCNADGRPDDCNLADGSSEDRDANGIPDECEAFSGDCDGNGIDDLVDLSRGAGDCDGDGDLDACEAGPEILLAANFIHRIGLGLRPRCAVQADLDGDGDLDAAVGGWTSVTATEGGSIQIVLNAGDGRLAGVGLHGVRGVPLQMAAGDIEGDGDIDLLALQQRSPCGSDAGLSLHRNRGGGAFERGPEAILPSRAGWMAAGDLEGDRRLEVFVSNPAPQEGCVILLRAEGAAFESTLVGPPGGATAVAAADWTSDGHVDLAAAGGSPGRPIHFLEGDGRGDFAPARQLSSEEATVSRLIPIDFDHDGDLDMIQVGRRITGDERCIVLPGNGPGGFPTSPFSIAFAPGHSVTVGDVDGDGREDLIFVGPWSAGDTAYTAVWFLRLGNGWIEQSWNGLPAFLVRGPVVALAGRWNGDAREDLLVADADSRSIAVLRNSPSSASRYFTSTAIEVSAGTSDLEAADFDGDGDPDLARLDPAGRQLGISRQAGRGFFFQAVSLGDRLPRSIAAGDVDLDGSVDLVCAAPFEVVILFQLDAGAFDEPRVHPVGADPFDVLIGDLDGDGDLDLASANRIDPAVADNVSILRNRGDGNHDVPRNYASARRTTGIATADMDSDGDADLVLSAEGAVLLRNSGANAVFGGPERLVEGGSAGPPVLGDVDSDGDPDLITVLDDIMLFRNPGGGGPVAGETIGRKGGRVLELLDLDRDADLDLVALDGLESHWLEVYRNAGRGSFGEPLIHDAGQAFPPAIIGGAGAGAPGSQPGASAIAAADFDEDGDPDLALGFLQRSWVTIAWNQTERAEPDVDEDGIPDVCASPVFRRGDADANGALELTDALRVLRWLFLEGEIPSCVKSGDVNDDGLVDITDGVRILNHLFLGTSPPADPYPACGPDRTADGLSCGSGC